MFRTVRRKPESIPVEISGIRVKPSPRARRMALRVETRSGDIVLTWPSRGASEKHARRFIEENRGWIESQRRKITTAKVFENGAVVSVLGRDFVIEQKSGRGLSRFEDGRIIVHGTADHLSRRVKDFLKKHALEILSARVQEKTAMLGLKQTSIRIIDPKTRWGSCAPDGRLMFSWRLILAPEEVLDYVVAHEVAHRVHMNHSRKFWALCLTLCDNGVAARRWLKKNGAELMRWV